MEGRTAPEILSEEGFANLSRRLERAGGRMVFQGEAALAPGELHPLDR